MSTEQSVDSVVDPSAVSNEQSVAAVAEVPPVPPTPQGARVDETKTLPALDESAAPEPPAKPRVQLNPTVTPEQARPVPNLGAPPSAATPSSPTSQPVQAVEMPGVFVTVAAATPL